MDMRSHRGRDERRFRAARVVRRVCAAVLLCLGSVACGNRGEEAAGEALRALDQGRIAGTRGTMEAIGRALAAYAIDNPGYPEGASLPGAMERLVPRYLPAPIQQDAWGRPFGYASDGATFTLSSRGDDGVAGSGDDLVMVDGEFKRTGAIAGG